MKPHLALAVLILVLLAGSVVSATLTKLGMPITAEDTFTKLERNDAAKREAVFEMDTKLGSALQKDALSFEFVERCGHVKSIRTEMWDNCTRLKVLYDQQEQCEWLEATQNETAHQECKRVPYFVGVQGVKYECWKQYDQIPTGAKKYRLKANIAYEVCSDGKLGYRVDWIPTLQLDEDIKLMRDEWAWWNVSLPYRHNLTYTCSRNDDHVTLKFLLNSSNFNYSAVKSPTADDLRVLDTDESTELNFYVYKWDNTSTSEIYVNVTKCNTTSNTIFLYSGNASAGRAYNESGVFSLFDDFDRADSATLGDAPVGGTWDESGERGGAFNISSGEVHGWDDGGSTSYTFLNADLSAHQVYEVKVNYDNGYTTAFVGLADDSAGNYMQIYHDSGSGRFKYRSAGTLYDFSPYIYTEEDVWFEWGYYEADSTHWDLYLNNELKKADAVETTAAQAHFIVLGSTNSNYQVRWDDVRYYDGDWDMSFAVAAMDSNDAGGGGAGSPSCTRTATEDIQNTAFNCDGDFIVKDGATVVLNNCTINATHIAVEVGSRLYTRDDTEVY